MALGNGRDDTIVLPPQARDLEPSEGRMSSRLGTPLPQRPPSVPIFNGTGGEPEIVIDLETEDGTRLDVDDTGRIGMPAVHGTGTQDENKDFGENLALRPEFQSALGGIGADIIQGVNADTQSRQTWTDQYNKGLDILGIKIEDLASSQGSQRNVSRVGHPLMIEAMVKYQAGAAAALLPAAGPCKVSTIGKATPDEEERARDFEDDMNYFLTDVATEYYDDTRQMLMHQAFCGIGYKKVFYDPIKRRPTSLSVNAPDLIVSEEATNLDAALRVTHQIQMLRAMVKRMQILGHYRDIELGTPGMPAAFGQQAQRKIKETEGLAVVSQRPQDQPYYILECDTDLDTIDIGFDGHYERKAPEGLPLPYKVTVDQSSQQVLGVWRNWRPGDELYLKRNMYVKYGLVPGMGYHNWGFMQLLGNQTVALRAIWRLLITAGMYASFPAGVKAKGARTSTNEIAPSPGEFVDIDATMGPGFDIAKLVMPLPFKEPSSVLVQLAEIIKQDAMRLGGTVELEVGEGRSNIPNGVMMAMVEQQVQVMAEVHKANHRAQKEEFGKIRELFSEDPKELSLLVRTRPRPTAINDPRIWSEEQSFMDLNLVPASDPNLPSKMHQLLVANASLLIAQQAGGLVDQIAVLRDAYQTMGKDPDVYVVQPGQAPPPAPDPKVVAATIKSQSQAAHDLAQGQIESGKLDVAREKVAAETAVAAAGNETDRQVAAAKAHADHLQPYHDAAAAPPAAPGPPEEQG